MIQRKGRKKSMSFAVEVWGNYAMFTRPEFKVERYSYDVMTPSAAIGFLKAIYWDPGFEYVIDRIHVLNPCLLYTTPSPPDMRRYRKPSSA